MRRALLLSLGLLLSMGRVSQAQPPPFSMCVSFDAAGTLYEGVVPGFAAPTRLYFLMLAMTEPIAGYESGISISGPNAEGWVIVRGTPVGVDADPDPDSYVVDLGECVEPQALPYIINTYDFGYFLDPIGPQDTTVCIGASTTANPSLPGHASYRTCAGITGPSTPQPCYSSTHSEFDGCASINPTYPGPVFPSWCDAIIVPTETTSWSHLKSKF